MSTRKQFLGVSLVALVSTSIVALWLFQKVYWPTITQPSTVSAAEAGDLQLLQALHKNVMSLDYHDKRKFMWTPLIAAAKANQSNVVAYLLQRGVAIDAKDASGKTALMWAVNVDSNESAIVQLLLEGGAKSNMADNTGSTVFDFAKARPQRDRLLRLLSQNQSPK